MKKILVVLAFLILSGCATILTLDEKERGVQVYKGIRADLRFFVMIPIALFDLPLSLVADTLVLPYTISQQIDYLYIRRIEDAIAEGDVESARRLLAAHPTLQTEVDFVPEGDMNITLRLLATRPTLSSDSAYDAPPLYLLSERGGTDAAARLLGQGADVNARYFNGKTPLHAAALADQFEMVQLLIERGANVNARDKTDLTPLHTAVFARRIKIISILVRHGAEVNARDDGGYTPLHLAARWGHIEAVRFLIKHGANIDGKNGAGHTPLFLALVIGHTEVSELLSKYGAT